MSMETVITTLIGLRLQKEKVFEKKITEEYVPSKYCTKHLTEEDAIKHGHKYCPTCGQHLFKKDEEEIPKSCIKSYPICYDCSPTDEIVLVPHIGDGDDIYLGIIIQVVTEEEPEQRISLQKAKKYIQQLETLKKRLEKNTEIWNEKEFGMWTVYDIF